MKVDLPAPFGPGDRVPAAGKERGGHVFEQNARAVAHGNVVN